MAETIVQFPGTKNNVFQCVSIILKTLKGFLLNDFDIVLLHRKCNMFETFCKCDLLNSFQFSKLFQFMCTPPIPAPPYAKMKKKIQKVRNVAKKAKCERSW